MQRCISLQPGAAHPCLLYISFRLPWVHQLFLSERFKGGSVYTLFKHKESQSHTIEPRCYWGLTKPLSMCKVNAWNRNGVLCYTYLSFLSANLYFCWNNHWKMSTLLGFTNVWVCFELVTIPCMVAAHKTGRACHRQECETKDWAVKALTFIVPQTVAWKCT